MDDTFELGDGRKRPPWQSRQSARRSRSKKPLWETNVIQDSRSVRGLRETKRKKAGDVGRVKGH